MTDGLVLTCEMCEGEDLACRGFSLRHAPDLPLLWFCTEECVVGHLIVCGDVNDGFSPVWGVDA
jgi:hypothetical protein